MQYKYVIIFPLVVVEGPIITVIAGFFTAGGFLSLSIVAPLIVVGDLVGDSLFYLIGKYAKKSFIVRFGKFFGLTEQKIDSAGRYLREHPHKSFTFGKIAHGPGVVVLIGAGMARVPYAKFISANVLPTLVKSLILFLIGYYFGTALGKVNKYLDVSGLIIGVLLIVVYIGYIKFSEKNI